MPDFSKLISLDYLFTIDRLNLAPTDWWYMYIGIGLVVIAAALRIVERALKNPFDRQLARKLFVLCLFAGLAEIIWFGARYQNVRFFGTHFVALIILLATFVWGSILKIRYWMKRSGQLSAWQKEQIKQKYLNS